MSEGETPRRPHQPSRAYQADSQHHLGKNLVGYRRYPSQGHQSYRLAGRHLLFHRPCRRGRRILRDSSVGRRHQNRFRCTRFQRNQTNNHHPVRRPHTVHSMVLHKHRLLRRSHAYQLGSPHSMRRLNLEYTLRNTLGHSDQWHHQVDRSLLGLSKPLDQQPTHHIAQHRPQALFRRQSRPLQPLCQRTGTSSCYQPLKRSLGCHRR